MEIAFRTKALRTVCLNEKAMDERFGAQAGALLRRWLADIRAAECLGDVPLLRLSAGVNRPGETTMKLGSGLFMVVKANHQRPPRLEGGDIEWISVDRILIQRIDREHA